MPYGRTRFRSYVSHEDPNPQAQVGSSRMGPYAGLPVGAELHSNWLELYIPFFVGLDLPQTGTNWTITETGLATQALSDDLLPPHLILTNAAADNDSQELQWTAPDASGEFVDFSAGTRHYFEIVARMQDANNDADTVEQAEWFFGFCVTDTTVIDGATDFIGFRNRDLDDDAGQDIDFVSADAGGAAGALVDGLVVPTQWSTDLTTSGVTATDSAAARVTRRANKIVGPNDWFKLGMLIDPLSDGSGGTAYIYVNNVHEATANLSGQVPDQNTCLTVAFQNGEAVAKILDICHIRVLVDISAL